MRFYFLLCRDEIIEWSRELQGVQEKLCVFFLTHCNPSLANIAARDLQSSQRNASVQSLLLAGNFLNNQQQPSAGEGEVANYPEFYKKNNIYWTLCTRVTVSSTFPALISRIRSALGIKMAIILVYNGLSTISFLIFRSYWKHRILNQYAIVILEVSLPYEPSCWLEGPLVVLLVCHDFLNLQRSYTPMFLLEHLLSL